MVDLIDIRDFLAEYVVERNNSLGFSFTDSSVDIEWELSKLSWWFTLDGLKSYLIDFSELRDSVRLRMNLNVGTSRRDYHKEFRELECYDLDIQIQLRGTYKDTLYIEIYITEINSLAEILDTLCFILREYYV